MHPMLNIYALNDPGDKSDYAISLANECKYITDGAH